jgi:tetratricopeptide (TPR) repeat protein
MNFVKPVLALTASLGLAIFVTGCRPKQSDPGLSSTIVEAMNRGVSSMGQYEYDPAVKAFETVLKIEPALTDARINLAIALFNRARKEDRDLERAGELLEAVLKSDADNVRACYFRGIVLQHIGKAEMAIPCFEKVVRQRPEDGVAWYLLGMCRQRLGQKAENELLKAIQLRPNLASAYYLLWQSFRAEGQMDKGQPFLDKFKQLRENPLAETIELPQYNQMGDLALARPLPAKNTPPITQTTYRAQAAQPVFETQAPLLPGLRPGSAGPTATQPYAFGGAAVGDLNGDGRLDVILTVQDDANRGRLVVLLGQPHGGFADATASAISHRTLPTQTSVSAVFR